MDNEDTILAFDLWDFAACTAAAIYPPLSLLALGQWFVRRNRSARQWVSRQIEDKVIPRLPAYTTESILDSVATRAAIANNGGTKNSAIGKPNADDPTRADNGNIIDLLKDKHHILFIGHTRGGKTTLMHALARLIAQESKVLFLDPDAIRGTYPGYKVVGAGDDYESIAKALQAVLNELATRREARANGQRAFEPFWIFADEVHDTFAEVDGSLGIFKDIIKRGAKLNMHVSLGTQDAQVKTLGLEGQSQLLINLSRVDLRYANGQRVATMDKVEYEVPELPMVDDTVKVHKAPTGGDALLTELLLQHSATRALERHDTAIFATTTTTTTERQNVAQNTVHKATDSGNEEQEKILRVAHEVIEERGILSRSEVSRRVFGTAGGASYNKVKMTLDKAGL